eukprot:GHVH01013138.1.p1 GENE.GHVH01013138.1~~GHVH01013138.1.p1  ORF type:complete len:142 (-),score=9.58 GHVH01013138.1:105-530(-)
MRTASLGVPALDKIDKALPRLTRHSTCHLIAVSPGGIQGLFNQVMQKFHSGVAEKSSSLGELNTAPVINTTPTANQPSNDSEPNKEDSSNSKIRSPIIRPVASHNIRYLIHVLFCLYPLIDLMKRLKEEKKKLEVDVFQNS